MLVIVGILFLKMWGKKRLPEIMTESNRKLTAMVL